MLFNSHIFIFVFLPATLIGFFALSKFTSPRIGRLWLVAMSLVFYAWWDAVYVFLLVGDAVWTYLCGRWIGRLRKTDPQRAKWALRLSIAGLLTVLGYYKYATFFAGAISAATGLDLTIGYIVLPLAISFFTFQMIAYLNDCYSRGEPGYDFFDFSLFVMFFPQLIAGPIVHHTEVIPQFRSGAVGRFDPKCFSEGIAFFVIGLIKKLAFADTLSTISTPVFMEATGTPMGALTAWTAALAFGLGLYFDFSGYSDMAIGLARMFGVRLPYNFASPYKARSIIDFWRRWHITLSRFLRDYLYIPLGGNRKGPMRRSVNLMATMLLGGLWHGAGWTFVFWGGLHGLYLLINHYWDQFANRMAARGASVRLGAAPSRAITLFAVFVAWVFFAAPSFDAAWNVLAGMAGANGFGAIDVSADKIISFDALRWIVLIAAALIALIAPNSQEIIDAAALKRNASARFNFLFQPNMATGVACAGGFIFALSLMADIKEFVYFQF